MEPLDKVVTVKLTNTIRYLKDELRKNDQRAAIVVDSRSFVTGVITVTDLLLAGDDNLVEDWYHSPPYTITPDRPIEVARKILNDHGNHQLIVVDARMKPLGILWDHRIILGCSEEEDEHATPAKKKPSQ